MRDKNQPYDLNDYRQTPIRKAAYESCILMLVPEKNQQESRSANTRVNPYDLSSRLSTKTKRLHL